MLLLLLLLCRVESDRMAPKQPGGAASAAFDQSMSAYPPDYVHDEAIIYTGRFLDDCRMKRLTALVASAKRDVWFLHDHVSISSYKYAFHNLKETNLKRLWRARAAVPNILREKANDASSNPFNRAFNRAKSARRRLINNWDDGNRAGFPKEKIGHGWKRESQENAGPNFNLTFWTKDHLKKYERAYKQSLQNVMEIPNLFVAPQAKGNYGNFIDVVNCKSLYQSCVKNSFLAFTVNPHAYNESQGPIGRKFTDEDARIQFVKSRLGQYKYYWSMEDDIFYTGSWEKLFAETHSPENNININDGLQKLEHFITDERDTFFNVTLPPQYETYFNMKDQPEMLPSPIRPTNNESKEENAVDVRTDVMIKLTRTPNKWTWHEYCWIFGKKCVASELPLSAKWFMARFSANFLGAFADAITNDIFGHKTYGFHEG